MAGILDKKERVMDLVVTSEGRRQSAQGQLKIAYATFTDMHTFYQGSGSFDVAEPADERIFFEASNRVQDVIVPELEPGNSLRPFRAGDFLVDGKNMVSGSFKVGFIEQGNLITGSDIVNVKNDMLASITNNFREQRILRTSDPFSDTSGFILSHTLHGFKIVNATDFKRAPDGKTSGGVQYSECFTDASPSLFSDRRFAHFPNFDYLPPVNLPDPDVPEGEPLGNYLNLGEPADLSFNDIEKSLLKRPRTTISFADSSRDNNLVAQVFEFSKDGVEKLSIIDAGEFDDGDPLSPGKHVYYIGKLQRDSSGAETFFNIFTLVFD